MPLDNVVTQPLKWLYYFPSPDAGLCRTPPPSFFTPARNAESDIGCGKQASEAAVVVGVDCQMKEKMVFLSECARWAPFVIFAQDYRLRESDRCEEDCLCFLWWWLEFTKMFNRHTNHFFSCPVPSSKFRSNLRCWWNPQFRSCKHDTHPPRCAHSNLFVIFESDLDTFFFLPQISDDDRMSLTTAISDDDEAQSNPADYKMATVAREDDIQ